MTKLKYYTSFLLSPLFGVLYALSNIKNRYALHTFFLFGCFFGFVFKAENPIIDSFRYKEAFYDFQYMDFNLYIRELIDYLSFSSNKRDFYFESVSFFVSRYTMNYHFLFFAFAIVFSFFQVKSLSFMTEKIDLKHKVVSYSMLAMFIMSNPIFNINGVRFWTAAWIAIYSSFQVFYKKKYKYIPLVLSTIFFHGSYLIFIVIFLFALLLPKNKKTFKFLCILYFFSFFFSHLAVSIFEQFIIYLPSSLKTFSSYLTDENLMKNELVGSGFYMVEKVFSILTSLVVFFMIIYIMRKEDVLLKKGLVDIFFLLLSIAAFSNFTMVIPSLGNRFMFLVYPLLAYVGIHFAYMKFFRFCAVLYISMSTFAFMIVLRSHIEITGPFFYLVSPIISILKNI